MCGCKQPQMAVPIEQKESSSEEIYGEPVKPRSPKKAH